MYTDPNNISNLVARMEKSGLIERIPFPEDKRQKITYDQPQWE